MQVGSRIAWLLTSAAMAAGLTAGAEVVQSDDGLSVRVTGDGLIERVVTAGTAWRATPKTACGFRVREYGTEAWTVPRALVRRVGKGVVVDATAEELGLSVTATFTARANRIDIEGVLIDDRKIERSAEVSLTLPGHAEGVHWWLDIAESADLDAAAARQPAEATAVDAPYALWIDAYDMDPQMAYVALAKADGGERTLAVLAEPASGALVNEKWRTFVVRGITETDFVDGELRVRIGNFLGDYTLVYIGAVHLVDARAHPADHAQASELMAKSEADVQTLSMGGWRYSKVKRRGDKGAVFVPGHTVSKAGLVISDGTWREFRVPRGSQRVGHDPDLPDGRTALVVAGAVRLPHLGYPWATVTANGGSGYTLAVSPKTPCIYSFAYEREAKTMSVALSYGLSSHPRRETLKNRAPFHLALYRTDHEWGFREAAKRYYELAPDLFCSQTEHHGFWYAGGPGFNYGAVSGMYAFFEAQGAMSTRGFASDRAAYETWGERIGAFFPRSAQLGVLVLPYRHFYHESLHGRGGQDGTLPRIPKDYDEAMRMFRTLKLPFGNCYGHHLAQTIPSSTMRTKEGKYDITIEQRGAICAPSGRIIFRTSASPYLYDDQPEVMTNARSEAEFARQLLERVPQCGGIYYDAGAGGGGIDYFPEHLRYAHSPLVPGPGIGRVVGKYEFCRMIAGILHPKGKVLFANGGAITNYQNAWHILGFDVLGIEHPPLGNDRVYRFFRTMCYHKPVTFLNFKCEGARVEHYVNCLCRIGLYDTWMPPFVRGSRAEAIVPQDLVAPYGKALQDMHRAGWEPVTHARCTPKSVEVERYGPRHGTAYFAMYNPDPTDAKATLTIDAKALGLARIAKAAEFCVLTRTISTTQTPDGIYRIQLSIPGKRLAVIQVGEDSVDDPVAVRDYYVAPREAYKGEMRKPRAIGVWAFDEGKGQTVADSGSGPFRKPNPGFLGTQDTPDSADPLWVTDPKRGSVLRFDGKDDVITILNRNRGALTRGLTVEAWVYRTAITPNARILACGSWDLFFTGKTDCVGLRLDGYDVHAAWSKPVPRNQWVHIKATYDSQEIRVYVNGELSGRKTFPAPVLAGARITIGNALNLPRPFAGMIDDVKIINHPQDK